jgi:hypothetical protein
MRELRHFFKERWVELLVAGVWLQSVISAAFTGNLILLALTTLGGLALLALIFSLVGRLRHGRRPPKYGVGEAFAVPRQALIISVGKQPNTAVFTCREQKPQWLGLLCSRATEGVADTIQVEAGLDDDHVTKKIADPWNIEELRIELTLILDWLARNNVPPEAIVIDITGGTAIMSAAAFSIAAERHIDSQYVRSDYDANNAPIPNTQRGVFVARYPEPHLG